MSILQSKDKYYIDYNDKGAGLERWIVRKRVGYDIEPTDENTLMGYFLNENDAKEMLYKLTEKDYKETEFGRYRLEVTTNGEYVLSKRCFFFFFKELGRYNMIEFARMACNEAIKADRIRKKKSRFFFYDDIEQKER